VSGQQIDSLTVGVGITQEDFQAGVEKILNSLGSLRKQTEATGESMTSSLSSVSSSVLGLGLKFAGLFLAVKGIEDVVGYFKNLSAEMSNLAYAGRYLGQSSVELSRFGEVAQLAGGQAQDAITAAQSLQSAIFGLEFQGQMSQNLLMLQRLGVGYLDAGGHMRDMKDIAFETAKALQQELPGQANGSLRVQWAAQIFGAGGLANAVGGGLNDLRKFYSTAAHDQKHITQRSMDAQMRLHQSLISLSYEVKSEAAAILTRLTPAIQDLINVIKNDLIPVIDEVIGVILHPIQSLSNSAAISIDAMMHPELLQKLARANIVAEKVPDSVMARFSREAVPDEASLNMLKIIHEDEGGDAGDPNWSKAITRFLGAYPDNSSKADFAQAKAAGRAGAIARPSAHTLSTPGAARPAAGKPTASTGGHRVQIGSIGPIYTQATDANGLMAGINRAAARKLLVAQADPGLA
jgi:hypothetical protein